MEAERSGLLTYEKSITLLYDTFGFRRDAFDRLSNEEKYLKTMNDAGSGTKLSILDYVTGKRVVDVGSGGGVLLDELERRFPDKEIVGTDVSANVIAALDEKKRKESRRWTAEPHNFVDAPLGKKADTIIFSSVIHEIYSYADDGSGKFDLESVRKAIGNAWKSLRKNGRVVIRDGVKTPGGGFMKIRFADEEGYGFFLQFLSDFRGMDHLDASAKCLKANPDEGYVVTDVNFGREFLYTYTWGKESFAHEVQECFGYYTVDDFRDLFESFGDARVVRADSFLEPGYKSHLEGKVKLSRVDGDGNETEVNYPARPFGVGRGL